MYNTDWFLSLPTYLQYSDSITKTYNSEDSLVVTHPTT
ncbi:hypothetical protein ACN38_g10292, partial [Penicillium nordicum]